MNPDRVLQLIYHSSLIMQKFTPERERERVRGYRARKLIKVAHLYDFPAIFVQGPKTKAPLLNLIIKIGIVTSWQLYSSFNYPTTISHHRPSTIYRYKSFSQNLSHNKLIIYMKQRKPNMRLKKQLAWSGHGNSFVIMIKYTAK